MRCKIRLRHIVRNVSCISGEAAIQKKDRLVLFFVLDFIFGNGYFGILLLFFLLRLYQKFFDLLV